MDSDTENLSIEVENIKEYIPVYQLQLQEGYKTPTPKASSQVREEVAEKYIGSDFSIIPVESDRYKLKSSDYMAYLSRDKDQLQGTQGVLMPIEDTHLESSMLLKMIVPTEGTDSMMLSGHVVNVRSILNERLLREARVLANLDHEGLPKVYDLVAIKDPDNGKYSYGLVMEKIDGKPLTDLQDSAQNLDSVVDIFTQLAEIIDYCNDKGIIYNDFDFHHVLVDKNGKVTLVDFGNSIGDYAHHNGMRRLVLPKLQFSPPEVYKADFEDKLDIKNTIDVHVMAVALRIFLSQSRITRITSDAGESREDFSGRLTGLFESRAGGDLVTISPEHHMRNQTLIPLEHSRHIPDEQLNAVNEVLLKATDYEPSKRYQSCKELMEAFVKAVNS